MQIITSLLLLTENGYSVHIDNNLQEWKVRAVSKRMARSVESKEDYTRKLNKDHQQNSKCFGQYCLPANYDRFAMPRVATNISTAESAVNISLDFDVRVYEVDDIKFTISLTMYFGVRWNEPRILKKNVSESNKSTIDRIRQEMIDYLWLPSIYVLNLKSYKVLDIFSEFSGSFDYVEL